ncbi:hypothetical protein [Epibacterium ulvae]|uniref:hypothetical protein n=1 Tax=Epibacterium ulvae TaxID=1156985 RepID=UPI002493B033|nr:hypothetical protein [Epibacterium ulvae]
MSDWLQLLKAEVKRTSVKEAATRIGYARTSVSLVIHGKYPGKLDKVRAAVLAHLSDQIPCPVTGNPLSLSEIETIRSAPMPTSDPKRLRQWIAIRKMAETQALQPTLEPENA